MANNKLNKELMAQQDALASADLSKTNKPVDSNKKKNKEKGDNGFVRFFKKIGKAFKEMFSEIKKVTWPTWKVALASLGTVLVVVIIFLGVVMGFDSLCAWLLSLLTKTAK